MNSDKEITCNEPRENTVEWWQGRFWRLSNRFEEQEKYYLDRIERLKQAIKTLANEMR